MNTQLSLTLAFKTLGLRDIKSVTSDLKAVENALEEIRQSGAAPEEIERAAAAAARQTAALRRELVQTSGSVRALSQDAGGISSAFRTLNIRGPAELRREIQAVQTALERVRASAGAPGEIARASAAAQARVRELRAELQGVAVAGESAGASIIGQFSGIVGAALAARQAVSAVQAVLQTGLSREALEVQLSFAFDGDLGRVGEEVAFVRSLTEQLGLEFDSTARAYAKLTAASKGTNLEGERTRDIFRAVASTASVLRLSADQTRGALTAIEQIISKGTVSAEELRGQLGERIPGAFQIAARAIGVTTEELQKLLESGSLQATEFLPAFAAELQRSVSGSLEGASNTLGAQLNRLLNRFVDFKDEIARAGVLDAVALQVDNLIARIDQLAQSGDLQKFADEIASAMSTAINVLAALADAAVAVGSALSVLAPVIAGLAAVKALGALGLLNSSLLDLASGGNKAEVAMRGLLATLGRGGAFAVIGLSIGKIIELTNAVREYNSVIDQQARETQKFQIAQRGIVESTSFARDAVRLSAEEVAKLSAAERASYESRLRAAADYYKATSELEARAAANSNVTPQAAIDALRESRAYEASLRELNTANNSRIQAITDFNARQAQAKDAVLATLKQKLRDQLQAYDNANKALETARKRREQIAKANDDFIAGLNARPTPDREANTGDVQAQIARARQANVSGDFEAAIKAGEQAKKLITDISAAGGSSADVLSFLAKQVAALQDQAAAGAEQAEQAKVAAVQDTINKLRTDAEFLKFISVGFDQAGAAASADQLRAMLQENLQQNPLVLPVVTVPVGGDAAENKRVDQILDAAPKRARGGKLFGPGTPTSDNLLLWGSPGEWMIKQRAVQFYGDDFMRAVNEMRLPRFAMGGAVGEVSRGAVSAMQSRSSDAGQQARILRIPGVGDVPVNMEAAVADQLEKTLRRESLKAGRR